MAQTKPINTISRQRVDDLVVQNGEPSWLKEARLKAWEASFKIPMPTARSEEWRRTEVELLDLSALGVTNIERSLKTERDLLSRYSSLLKYIGQYSGIVVDGIASSASNIDSVATSKGVIFCSLNEALEKHEQLIRPYLEKSFNEEVEQKFSLMNKALFNRGAFLYIPANVDLSVPFISIVDASALGNASTDSSMSIFPRLIVVCEPNSKSTQINFLGSPQPNGSRQSRPIALCNSSIEIHVGDGAQLSYLEVQNFDKNVFSITHTRNEIGRDAKLSALTVALSGRQIKSDIATILAQPGAFSDIYGLALGDGHEHFSFNTVQGHNAPDTTSNITFKVVLKDEAMSVYQGIIRVAKVAQRTDAYQSNKNLLLGSNARADSIPKLEILADDVKCSHGATVGPVDKEQIFYLMSRGLDVAEAEELIVTGFFRQVLDACTISGAADWIYDLVITKMSEKEQEQS
jgi:Fe-S cluster assembly protein SufD